MVLIQTHNGKIHADETIAIALLSNYYSKNGSEVSILRSRDPRDFPNSNILIDVGHEYSHVHNKYDHHQDGFQEKWSPESPTILSAAGLVWRHYGDKIIEMYLSSNWEEFDFSENFTEDIIEELVDIIYQKIFLEVDANDNGIVVERQEGINISSVISSLNHHDTSDDQIQNKNFFKAIELVSTILDIEFKQIIKNYFNYSQDMERVKRYDLSGDYLIVPEKIPTVFKCLEELDPDRKIKFLIFSGDKWTIKTRNTSKFSPICPLPADFDSDDVLFLHKSGFLAKTKTLDAAKRLIEEALRRSEKNVTPVKSTKMKIAKWGTIAALTVGATAWWLHHSSDSFDSND